MLHFKNEFNFISHITEIHEKLEVVLPVEIGLFNTPVKILERVGYIVI